MYLKVDSIWNLYLLESIELKQILHCGRFTQLQMLRTKTIFNIAAYMTAWIEVNIYVEGVGGVYYCVTLAQVSFNIQLPWADRELEYVFFFKCSLFRYIQLRAWKMWMCWTKLLQYRLSYVYEFSV